MPSIDRQPIERQMASNVGSLVAIRNEGRKIMFEAPALAAPYVGDAGNGVVRAGDIVSAITGRRVTSTGTKEAQKACEAGPLWRPAETWR